MVYFFIPNYLSATNFVGIKVTANGPTGHGSQFIQHTAASKLVSAPFDIDVDAKHLFCAKLLAFRASEQIRLENGARDGKPLSLGDVTSTNWTMTQGGVQFNVVPETMEAGSNFLRMGTSPASFNFVHCNDAAFEVRLNDFIVFWKFDQVTVSALRA